MTPYELPNNSPLISNPFNRSLASFNLPKLPDLPLPDLPQLPLPALPDPTYHYIAPKSTYTPSAPTQQAPKVEPITQEPYYSDPYDSDQINSVADVISKTFDKSENGGHVFSFSTLLDSSKELWQNTVLTPLKNKDYKALLLNNLVNLGETMDVVSNVVKAAVPIKYTTGKRYADLQGSTVSQRVQAALGLGVQGRYTFDYDLGHTMAVDLLAEIAFDPMTWLTFGSEAIAKSVAKVPSSALKAALKEMPGGLGLVKDLTKDSKLFKGLVKQTSSDFLKKDSDAFVKDLEVLIKQPAMAARLSESTRRVLEKNPEYLKQFGDKLFEYSERVATHRMNMDILQVANTLIAKPVKSVDKMIVRASFMPLAYPTYFVARYVGAPAARYIAGVIQRSYMPYKVAYKGRDFGINFMDASEIRRTIEQQFQELHAADIKIKHEEIQKIYQESLVKSTHGQIQSILDAFMTIEGWEDVTLATVKASPEKYRQILDGVHERIQAFTQGRCSTITEYVKNYLDAIRKDRTLMNKDVVDNLNKLYNLEYQVGLLEKTNTAHVTDYILNAAEGAFGSYKIGEHSVLKYFSEMLPSEDLKNLEDLKQFTLTKDDVFERTYQDFQRVYREVEKVDPEALKYMNISDFEEYASRVKKHLDTINVTELSPEYYRALYIDTIRTQMAILYCTDIINLSRITKSAAAQSEQMTRLLSLDPQILRQFKNLSPSITADFYGYTDYIFKQYIKTPYENLGRWKSLDFEIELDAAYKEFGRNFDIRLTGYVPTDPEINTYYDKLTKLIHDISSDKDKGLRPKIQGKRQAFDLWDSLQKANKAEVSAKVTKVYEKLFESAMLTKSLNRNLVDELDKPEAMNRFLSAITDAFNEAIDALPKDEDSAEILTNLLTDLTKQSKDYIESVEVSAKVAKLYKKFLNRNPVEGSNRSKVIAFLDRLEEVQSEVQLIANDFKDKNYIRSLEEDPSAIKRLSDSIDAVSEDIVGNPIEQYFYQQATILDKLDQQLTRIINPYRAAVEDGHNYVRIAMEQFMNSINITTSALPMELHKIFGDTDTGKWLKSVRENLGDSLQAKLLKDTFDELEQYSNKMEKTRLFMQTVALEFNEPTDTKFIAFMESFQNFGQSGFDTLSSPSVADAFMQRMRANLNGREADYSTSLDRFRARFSDPYNKSFQENMQQMAKWIGGEENLQIALTQGHDNPASDLFMTKLQHLYADVEHYKSLVNYQQATGQKVYYFDIETVERWESEIETVNKHTGEPSQIALMQIDTNEPIVFRKNGPAYSGPTPANCVWVDDVLQAMDDYLKVNNAGRLVGANSHAFDVPFIKRRWNPDTYENSWFSSIVDQSSDGHIDLYNYYLRKAGVTTLGSADYDTVSRLLKEYVRLFGDDAENLVQELHPKDVISCVNELYGYIHDPQFMKTLSAAEYNSISQTSSELIALIDNLKNLSDNYRELTRGFRASQTGVLLRNIYEDTFDPSHADELAEMILKHSDNTVGDLSTFYDLLQTAKEDYRLNPNKKSVAQMILMDHWRWHYLYEAVGGDFKNFRSFKNSILKAAGRKEITNLQQLLRALNPGQFGAYRHVIKQSVRDIFTIPEGVGLPVYVREQMVKVSNKVKNMVDYRIKNVAAIYNLPSAPFRDRASLIASIRDLIDNGGYNELHWATYIDLDATFNGAPLKVNDKALFGIWYSLLSDQRRIVNASEFPNSRIAASEYNRQHMLTAELNSEIQRKIFDVNSIQAEVNATVFFDKTSSAVHKAATSGSPILDIGEAHSLQQVLAELSEQLDYIPNAGAKEFAARQRAEAFSRIMKRVDRLPRAEKEKVFNAWDKAFKDANILTAINYLDKAIDTDIDKAARFLVADLIFHNPIKVVTILKHPKTRLQRIYAEKVEALVNNQEALLEYGIAVEKSATGDNYILRLKARYDPEIELANGVNVPHTITGLATISADYKLGTATFRGQRYNLSDARYDVAKLSTDNLLIKEDLETFNAVLGYISERTNHNGTGWLISNSNRLNYLYDQIPAHQFLDVFTYEDYHACGFFEHNSVDTSQLLLGPKSNVIKNMSTLYSYVINSQKNKDLFIDMFMNPQTSITFSKDGVLKGLTDKEIYSNLSKQTDFVPCMLVEDASIQGYRIQRVAISNQASLDWAREHNVVLVPYQVFSTAFDTINNMEAAMYKAPKGRNLIEEARRSLPKDFEGSEDDWINSQIHDYVKNQPLFHWRQVMFTYKLGYLSSVGTVFRNVLDSYLKASLDTGSPGGMLKNTIKSNRLLVNYHKTLQMMHSIYPEMSLTTTGFKEFFARAHRTHVNVPMSEADFLAVHGFVTNGPSAGESKLISDWASEKHANKYGKRVENTSLHTMVAQGGKALLWPMGIVESRARLAQYLTLMDQGITKTQAFSRVSRTAFDYDVKTNFDRYMELIIPFFTFQKLNLNYWLHALATKPATARFIDAYWDAMYNGYDINADDYNRQMQMQMGLAYQLTNGNLVLGDRMFADDSSETAQMVLKINPSFMDVFNILTDPKDAILNSTIAPLQNFIKYASEDAALEKTREELLNGTYIVKYGKFSGHQISEMLQPEHRGYVQWLLTQPDFIERNKPVYDFLMYNKVYENPVMPWGKFYNVPINEVPDWYKEFMLQQDWFNENWAYLADIFTSGRTTVVSEEDIDNASIADYQEVEAALASGLFMDEFSARYHLDNVLKKTATDVNSYPIIGALDQRMLGVQHESTSQKNKERLEEAGQPVKARVAQLFPTMFSAVKRYKKFVQDEVAEEKPPIKMTYTSKPYKLRLYEGTNRFYYPRRPSRNYYPPSRARQYKQRPAYNQFAYSMTQRQKRRYNINYLHN